MLIYLATSAFDRQSSHLTQFIPCITIYQNIGNPNKCTILQSAYSFLLQV